MSADSKDEIVRILVREGRADLLGRDESSGNTALHTCVIFNRVRLAKLLVELWAEVQEKRKAFWNARNAALDGDTRDDFGYKRDEPPLSFKLGDAKNYDQLTPATLCAKEYSNQGELFSGLWEWELVPNWRYGNIVRVNYNLDGVDNIVDIVKGRVGNSETVFDLMTFHDVHKILGTTQSLQALVKLKWKHYGKYAVYRRGMFAFFYVVNLAFLIIFRRDGAGVGHGQLAGLGVLELEVLVRELGAVDALAARAVAGREVAALQHELRDDAVEGAALEVQRLAGLADALLARAQRAEVLGRLRLRGRREARAAEKRRGGEGRRGARGGVRGRE